MMWLSVGREVETPLDFSAVVCEASATLLLLPPAPSRLAKALPTLQLEASCCRGLAGLSETVPFFSRSAKNRRAPNPFRLSGSLRSVLTLPQCQPRTTDVQNPR